MRIVFAAPLLLVAACQVNEDDANDSVSIEYNQDVAEEAVEDVAAGAEEAGEAIVNGTKDVAEEVDKVDVDVDVDRDANANRN